jgi:hypothetical protein
MELRQAMKIHPELVDLDRGAVLRALEFVEACCQGRHDHFGLLDQDKEMYQAFKVLVFGKCHFPPLEKLGSGHLQDGAEHTKELCPRSFDAASQCPAENNGVLVTTQGKRGPKFHKTPDDIIRDLALNRGQGARKITAELERRGFSVNLRTVTRRLSAIHSQELPLFKN